jgi:hypothetical protein
MEKELNVSEVEGLIEDLWNDKLSPAADRDLGEFIQQLLSLKGYQIVVELTDENGRSKRRDSPISQFNPAYDEIRIYFQSGESGEESVTVDEEGMNVAIAELVGCLKQVETEDMPFVSLKWFRDTILPKKRFSWVSSRQKVLAEAISRGLVETYKVNNPIRPDFPTTAIKVVGQD